MSEEVTLQPANIQEEEPVIELGDRIRLLGNKHDKTTGRVIYRTAEELHLMPDGLTNTVLEFTLTEDGFDPEAGVESVEILSKRKKPSLIEILDLNVDQMLETFGPSGEAVSTYTIVKIIPEEDTIVIKNDEEGEVILPFNYRGIPKGLPFRVIRSRQAPEPVAPETSEDAEQDDQAEADETLEDYTFLDAELDIPAEGIEYLVEIPTADRTYPVIEQKSEAYAELLSLNTLPMQKLAATQKSAKVLTELFFQLRSSILRLSEDGNPKGVNTTSIEYLIDILRSRRLTLSRPILDVNKVLYHDMEKDEMKSIKDTLSLNLVFKNFDETVISSTRYLNAGVNTSKFVPFLNEYLKTYAASWVSNGGSAEEIAFQRDEEGFRKSPPDLKASTIPGYPSNLPLPKKGNVSSEMLSNVSLSIVRGLKATIAKRQLLQPGEEAAVLGYVLFPLAYANSLSLTRNESLIQDVEAGLSTLKTIKEIIEVAGEVSDVVSPSHPTLIGVEGGTIGNIALEDYLKFLGLKAEGMGDIWPLQTILGMKENEWTIEQQAVLIKIIRATQLQIISEIVRQRELLEQLVSQPPAIQGIQLTPDGPAMIQKLSGEKYILDIQSLIKEQMPAYANSDVALVGLVIRQHPEMAFAQLADQPAALTRERMRYARQEYLSAIRSNQLIKRKATDEGELPIPVNCSHVKPLQMIRKVKDVNLRLALMSKFLMTFQGTKEDNWVYCNAAEGDSHKLLCVHELLQIYQFLRPGDVAVLNKDIQLNYGGGQFQGYYICRNCGQPISELEFDTHLEFDDNGNPMMGRAELVDQDAITMQQIDEVLGPAGGMDTPIEFDTEQKRFIFTTTKVLAERLHAPLEKADYLQVVMRTYSFLQTLPSKERYMKDLELAQAKSTGKKAVGIDYFIYYNRLFIGALGAAILICIQTKRPDIVLQGNPGCRILGGQPLEEKGTSGIECIVTAIASANTLDSPPWSLARFQDDKVITMSVNQGIQSALRDPTVLQDLAVKRDWKRKVLGAEGGQGRPDEIVPLNFAPIPYVMDATDFVEKVIIDESATVEDRAELWIRQGNALAKKNKMPMPIVFSEASCCISPISTVDSFWRSSKDSLPSFSMRLGIVSPPRITRTEPTMKPSQIVRPLPDAPEDSYYLLFLKVCFDGERKGYPHEFGLTHHCMWCGLKFTDVDQGLQAVKSQGIEVTKETFEDLLNETHRVNSFASNLRFEIPSQLDTWTKLTTMDPEPATGYREVMLKTREALLTLAPDANEIEVARALSQFSRFADEMESNCKSYFSSQAQHRILDSIVSNGAESIVRFLQTYCIVPLQQFASKYTPPEYIQKSWGLAEQHESDIKRVLSAHHSYLIEFINTMPMTAWLKGKIETFILQAQSILSVTTSLRPLQLPGRAQTYEYLLKFCFFAPLANFVDPGDGPSSDLGQDILIPAKIISKMINHFNKEGFKLTPEQIREMIAKRNEVEKANILSTMSGLGKAGKEIEMIKMRLGIGKWAVGGTKAIYAYDKERYDVERDERAQAGIIDFPGYGPEGPRGGQPKTDALGFDMTMGQEEGYIGDDQLGDIMGFDEE